MPGSKSESTSSALLHKVQAKDQDAWKRLVDWIGPLIVSWCRQSQQRPEDLEDISQNVFCRVHEKIGNYKEGSGSSFRGWLRVITRHVIIDHIRRTQKQPQAKGGEVALKQLQDMATRHLDETDPNTDQRAQILLLQRALGMVRNDFAENVWQAFWETVAHGRPNANVADELGMKVNSVVKAKARVRKRLCEEFGKLTE